MERYFAAVNADDLDRLMTLFADDAVVHVPGVGDKRGTAEIRRFYSSVDRLYAEHYDATPVVLAEGDHASALIEFTGRTRDGRAVHFWAADTFRFEAGRIAELRVIFDPATIRG